MTAIVLKLLDGQPEKCATMGNIFKKIFGNKEMRILMLGLDAAGKTSTSYWPGICAWSCGLECSCADAGRRRAHDQCVLFCAAGTEVGWGGVLFDVFEPRPIHCMVFCGISLLRLKTASALV